MRIAVVDKDHKPLMPTTPARARKWVESGKAVKRWSDAGQFYVQLTCEPSGRNTQDIVIGIDLTVLDEAHLSLLKRRATITRDMPPPRLLAEVVSPGDEDSDNYQRDYAQKPQQYASIGVPEYWIIDPDRAWVMVGQLVDGTYEYQTFQGDDAIQSPTFPGLELTAVQVLGAGA